MPTPGRSDGERVTEGQSASRRGAETFERIIEAASVQLADHGIDFTLDDVARAAGVTRMTIHRRVGGRERLLTHLVLRDGVRLMDQLRPLLDDEAEQFADRIVNALAVSVEAIRASPALSGLFKPATVGRDWPDLDPDHEIGVAVLDFFFPYFEQAERFHILRASASDATSWVLSQVLLYLTIPETAPDDDEVRRLLKTFVLPGALRL